jgi:hypothetical protein
MTAVEFVMMGIVLIQLIHAQRDAVLSVLVDMFVNIHVMVFWDAQKLLSVSKWCYLHALVVI